MKRRRNKTATDDLVDGGDIVDELTDELDAIEESAKGGFFRGIFRLVTLPFRIAIGLVKLVLRIAGLVIATILLPIRVAMAVVKRVIALAADLTYGIWRLVMRIVGLVLGVVKFFFSVLNATIGGAIRLVFGIIKRVLKLVLGVFLIGFRLGRRGDKKSDALAEVVDAASP